MGQVSSDVANLVGLVGLVGGLGIGFLITAGEPERATIGINFKDAREANLRREFGLLSKDQLDKAVSQAVEQYMATGSTKPVIVDLPPRPVAPAPQKQQLPPPPPP